MSDFWKELDATTVRVIELILLIGGLIWGAAFLRADVNDNTQENKRQNQRFEAHTERARQTYMRRDLSEQQYQHIIDKLETIDKKLER